MILLLSTDQEVNTAMQTSYPGCPTVSVVVISSARPVQPATPGKVPHLGLVQSVQVCYLVAMSIVEPFPESKSGSKYILVVSDYLTKWVEAYGIVN